MRLVLGLLLTLLAIQSSLSNGPKHQKKTKAETEQTDSNPEPSAGPTASVSQPISQPPGKVEKTSSSEYPKTAWEKAFAPETWATWAAFIVGAGVLYIYWRTLSAIEISADAAKASADGLKAIERPWLLISEVNHSKGWFKREDGTPEMTPYSNWKFLNYGKTPARILEVGGNLLQVPNLDVLPAEPIYKKAPDYTDYTVLPPGIPSGSVKVPEREFISDYMEAARKGLNLIVVSGFVKYTDPWNDRHETRFCYLWNPMESRFSQLVGPPAYNRHT